MMDNKERCDMKKSLFILTFLFGLLFAQDTIWIRRLDTGWEEIANGIASFGEEIAIAGYIWDGEQGDVFVAKYNQAGETLWTRRFDTGFDDYAIDVAFDNQKNILVSGYSPLLKSKGPKAKPWWPKINLSNKQYFYSLTIKCDSTGERRWMKQEIDRLSFGITTDQEGNVYTGGGVLTEEFNLDFWFQKYNTDGETVWSKTFHFAPINLVYRLATDREGNILAAGTAWEETSVIGFIFKISPAGETIWTRTYRENIYNYLVGVAADQNNNVIACGIVGDTINADYLILKYDPNGNLLWATNFDNALDDEAFGVATDQNNNIFVTGLSGDYYLYDYLTLAYDPAGNNLWLATYDNGDDDEGGDVICDGDGNPIVTGTSFANNYDFLTIKYHSGVGLKESKPFSTLSKKETTIFAPPIKIAVSSSGYYEINLYDYQGREVRKIYQGYLSAGTHLFPVKKTPSGLYFLRFGKKGEKKKTLRVISLH
ncbi:MAG: hypothetical protein ABIK99_02815 [candidate division WOR-3 bacterium]